MKRHRSGQYYWLLVLGIVIVLGIAAILLLTGPDATDDNGAAIDPDDNGEPIDPDVDVQEVWDCSNESCIRNTITETVDCSTPAGVQDEAACERTTDGLEDVTMITDDENHVPVPMTDEDLDVELLDIRTSNGWDMTFIDENRFLVTEQAGTVTLYDADTGNMLETAELDATAALQQSGLLGVAADPDFDENRHIYLYYYDRDAQPAEDPELIYNRISRFTFQDNQLQDEQILLDEIEGGAIHSGGRLAIGPDGRLWATTGDAGYSYTNDPEKHERIQDLDFLGGKTLRINMDGSIPADNPFTDSPVYTNGHRNVQGLDFHPGTGEPFISEHGPWRHDELNHLQAGENYGWPAEKCDQPYEGHVTVDGTTTSPIACIDEWTLAPAGVTFTEGGHAWEDSLFTAGLRGSMVHRTVLDRSQRVQDTEIFYVNTDYDVSNRIRDVAFSNGALYVLTDDGHIKRIRPAET